MHAPDTDRVIPLTRSAQNPKPAAPAPDQAARLADFLFARANAIAWISILCGALSGMVMGLWSFGGPLAPPAWIGGYDDLPRRFLRLAHVAMFALGALHIIVAKRLSISAMPHLHKVSAYVAMAAGNVLMPVLLIAAAVWEPVKYLTPVPALSLTIAFLVVAQDAVRTMKRV